MLTQKHKERRVQWALQHKDDDWSRTVFSDETSYQLFRNTIRRWSKNPPAEFKRIPKNRQKIMVWGAFSIKGPISCHSFQRIMDGPHYVQILQEHLLRGARKQFGRQWRFQQDNDPKHTSRVAKGFLDQHVPETIDWPANSPDLVPIEILKKLVVNPQATRGEKKAKRSRRIEAILAWRMGKYWCVSCKPFDRINEREMFSCY